MSCFGERKERTSADLFVRNFDSVVGRQSLLGDGRVACGATPVSEEEGDGEEKEDEPAKAPEKRKKTGRRKRSIASCRRDARDVARADAGKGSTAGGKSRKRREGKSHGAAR